MVKRVWLLTKPVHGPLNQLQLRILLFPLLNNNQTPISEYHGKKLMIVTFLAGKAKSVLTPMNCKQVGEEVAKMHNITKTLKLTRVNDLSIKSWRKMFDMVKNECTQINIDLPRRV